MTSLTCPGRVRLVSMMVAVLAVSLAEAADFRVAVSGDDANAGTAAAPFRTLGAAQRAARQMAGREAVTVQVADGVYYLAEPLVFTPADSGTAAFPVVYRAEHEGKAVVSGGQKLVLQWTPYKDGIFRAATPAGLVIDQLFVDGRCQRMARYPNFDPAKTTVAYQGCAADAFSKERAARWADPAGGYIHAMHSALWGGYHYRITGKKPDGTVAYEGGWQNNRQMGMHGQFRMVENIFEELDAPGEWFHDAKAGMLYYQPEPGTDLARATVEAVRLRDLVEFRGSAAAPVRQVALQGFVFRHAARTFMDNKEPLLRSDWTICRRGTVLLTGTEDVKILDCEFDQPGGTAVFVNLYNRRLLVKGCHIHDTGACGIAFVGDPAAVRNPLFEYNQKQNLAKLDRTPGPQGDNWPGDCAVEDCLIHGIGRVERQASAVEISMSSGIAVRDTSIYDCNRSGINIGDGCWGGHVVERCDIFDTVLETGDHGSFNSWGRDRYWNSNHRQSSQPEVQKDPGLPFLDVVKPIVLRDSRWRCDHGWDIDLDDGSSHYQIYNNLLLHGGLKFREGYGRKAWNNILVNNGFHPHVWFDDSDSVFTNNIVMEAPAPIGQPAGWGQSVDHNLFAFAGDLAKARAQGADAHSRAGDPQFVDPAKGDFRVKEGSPALALGFKNFPMDQFGVKKPALRAIAKTPEIPALKEEVHAPGKAERPCFWLGARLHDLGGEEFSAFGVARESGGVQLATVPPGSPAAAAGLKENDLLQSVNGQPIKTSADLLAQLAGLGDGPLEAGIVRDQKPRTLTLKEIPFQRVERVATPDGWMVLKLPAAAGTVQANGKTNNEPVASLADGRVAKNYGPVFSNQVATGAYRLDLGTERPVAAITAWSYNQNGNRGAQFWTAYGSTSATDPGWNTADPARFTPIGTVGTASLAPAEFSAVSLRARPGQALGRFRWIVWRVFPVTPEQEENTAFQELSAE